MIDLLIHELRQTILRPRRLLSLLSPARVSRYLKFQRLRWIARSGWQARANGVATRRFSSYEDYVELQQSKLDYLDLRAHESKFRSVLGNRMQALGVLPERARVLCLGARLGAEVAAFRDLGAFAIGVDLNPGRDNPWVVYGDFHQLQFPDHSVDLVYSNSLDHSFDIERVVAEVRRVLASEGRFVVEADPGVDDPNGVAPDLWATFQWPTVSALSDRITGRGFELISSSNFQYPRGGTCLVFRSLPRGAA